MHTADVFVMFNFRQAWSIVYTYPQGCLPYRWENYYIALKHPRPCMVINQDISLAQLRIDIKHQEIQSYLKIEHYSIDIQ